MHRRTVLFLIAGAGLAPSAACAIGEAGQIVSAPLTFDSHGRPVVDVMLNGQGPFPLVLDTAASATVLSAETVAQLALQPSRTQATMRGASGHSQVDLYTLSSVTLGALSRQNVMAAALPHNPSDTGHAGVLGASLFAGARIELDIPAAMLHVDTTRNRARLAGAHLVGVDFRNNMFALAPVSLGSVAATALVDTGARRTVANSRLREALGYAADDPRFRAAEAIGGATAQTTATVAVDAQSLALAGHDFGPFELTFADLPVFTPLGLVDRPSLILGLDVLSRVRGFTLDYASAQFELRV